ncbi:hypothetical protein QWY85_07910 [Neolewinella lacunae]|uniref:Uncharacterized protein n=1 Tax=Neolewinella lacunae TaxID=1517758 RepID=A0A923T7N4_9BACT|nr:hypothetical protein [Neolewinella lacunae]MBC6994705.1 hypothetical protein [Neolewinella lacunae]MDN3634577.1 hypothetical protein [Neolewinella lacunae]
MSFRKIRWSSVAFVLILGLSGACFGFLLGRIQHHNASSTTQFEEMGSQVKATSEVLFRGADLVKRLLVK